MKIIILSPHPDDEIIGCGGTIAKHIAEGDEVKVIYLTSGEKGGDPIVREQESIAALKILGVKEWEFLKFKDGELIYNLNSFNLAEWRCPLEKILKKEKPELVYLPCKNESHQDHRALNWHLTIKPRKFKMKLYEVFPGLSKIKNEDYVDITPYIDFKIKALKCFKSQKLNLAEAYRCLARFRGIFTGKSKFCECFQIYK